MERTTPWTLLGSVTLLEDRWIRLRADRLRTATGAEIAPWYVLDYPDWAVVVATTDSGEVVLVRQWRHAAQCWSLELPGGVIDAADPSPEAAAARELLEETGYAAPDWRHLYAAHPNPAIQTNRLHVLRAARAVRVAAPAHEPGETMEVVLVSVAEARRLARRGGIGQAMHVGALLAALEDPA
jgi:8-oxo-dGTP pyrophosphatase MutT (NUDIX family)